MNFACFLILCPLCLVLFLASCSLFESEPPIERERKKLQKVLNGFRVTYWRGAKITVRSLPVPPSADLEALSAIHEEHAKKLNLGPHLSSIFRYATLSVVTGHDDIPKPDLPPKAFVGLAKEIYQLRETIKDKDEDEFPTFIEVISNAQLALGQEPETLVEPWTSALEHWIFALAMETKTAPEAWRTYELSKIDPKQLHTTDLKIFALAHTAIDHIRHERFYLADESLSSALSVLKTGPVTFYNRSVPPVLPVSGMPPEQAFGIQMRGLLSVLRGYARFQTGDAAMQPLVITDIQQALEDFAKIGFDNELTWCAAIFTNIKQDNPEAAIRYLEKLETSDLISEKEKKIVADAKSRLKHRDPDAALNFITDRLIILELGSKYAYSYLREVKWAKLLEKSETGKRILAAQAELEERFEAAKKYLDKKTVVEKGKRIWEDMTKD